MIDIPTNDGDNAKSRMDAFVQYCVDRFTGGSDCAEIYDYKDGNDGKVPGITEGEARELARMFAAKGYHASAYYIDYPRHGFRRVSIAKYVMDSRWYNCAHTDKWA